MRLETLLSSTNGYGKCSLSRGAMAELVEGA